MPLSLLVVGDERDAADGVVRLLRQGGFDAHAAYSGEQALEIAASISPQVFVLDIGMPILNGYELARQLRARPEFARRVYIALTGYSDQEHLDEASRLEFDEYLVKPVKQETLLAILNELSSR